MNEDKLPTFENALYWCKLIARDAERIKVTWDFDEQQADPCHHNFDGRHFIRCLNVVLKELENRIK